jgi:uncharacterized OsmC-like protein
MTWTADQVEAIRHGLRAREHAADPAGMRRIDRIEIEVVGGLEYEARNPAEPDGLMRIGEPIERGGTGRGASPLAHFLTGVAACLLNQFVRVVVAEGYPVTFTGTSVRGEFRREPGQGFERIRCEIRADGSLDSATAEALVERAERLCYVHCTLSRVIEMTTVLVVGNTAVVTRVAGPELSGPAGPVLPRD